MRYVAPVILMIFLAAAGMVRHDQSTAAMAQEATPCPLWPPRAPDITTWEVSQFSQWPSTTLEQFEPGAQKDGYDGTHKSPVIELIYVQTGVFTLQSEVRMAINRGEDGSVEVIAPESEFTVSAGDYFVIGPIAPAIRNDGPEAASSYQSAVVYPASATIIDPCAPRG